ncbi:unnamed protein product (macronuclear) [Paramecium tetraurelia]|uniref:Transmembrane protein n=1 Tax=Paramecium tetraurelia TaxID=5888 RepID=A0BS91_PARTE|nr:uncharacterized protein GSPATT00031639001 [Paramecium tetraurelia]CAK61408.1 unnamed protein product [Paramecium tetraurelia]|eukprot:XP_001428806.1 hypothetical protein (macronuclear) [Paramecium tetraurelia strain d4-2]
MNLISLLLFVALLTTPCFQKCSQKVDSLTVYATKDEKLNWNLMDEFFNGAGLTFSLSDIQQNQFKIVEPVENTGGSALYSQAATKIVSSRALKSNKYWVNSFVFLNKGTTSITLGIAYGEAGQSVVAPKFDEVVTLNTIEDSLDCYDLEIIADKTFIVDCSKKVKGAIKNVLYYVNDGDSYEYLIEDALVQANHGRMLGQYKVKGQGEKEYRYLVRATASYSMSKDGSLGGDSLLEVFLLNDKGQPSNTGYVLDGVTMALLLDKYYDFEFNIVDMKVLENGDIYLLDAQYDIFIVNFIPNGTFSLKNSIDTGMSFAYAFDRNIFLRRDGTYTENIAVLGYGFVELIVDGQLQSEYKLPIGIHYTFPANVDLSQEFIVVRHEDATYLFDIDAKSKDLLQLQVIPQTSYVMINPFLPDIIVLTLDTAYRYTLSQGYLQYKGSEDVQEKKMIEVIATSVDQTCKVQLTYQIIESDDKQLYKYSDTLTPFPNQVTEDAQPFQLNVLTSGPNEQYKQIVGRKQDGTAVTVQLKTYWELNFPQELQKDLLFHDVLVGTQSSYFYLAQQNKDGKLTILKVIHDSIFNGDVTYEKVFDSVSIGTKLTKSTFQMWECECPKFHFAYVENRQVNLKVFSDNQVKDIKTIPFENGLSILFLKNYLFLLQNANVHAYTEHGDFVKSVDLDLLVEQGYKGTWAPKKIYGNRKIRENLIFVVHQDHITLIDFHISYTFIKQIAIDESDNIEIAIGAETFFIITNQVIEYDFDRLNNIYQTKTVQLYDFELVQPILGDFCSDTGYLFVLAKTKSQTIKEDTNKYHLLVIQPNTLQHEALFQAVPIDEPQLISTQGTSSQMYVYLQTKTSTHVYAMLTNPVLIIEPSINDPQFAASVDVSVMIYNFDDTPSITIKQPIKVINTQTKLYIDKNKFKASSIEIDSKDYVKKEKKLGSDWYSGQISQFQIICEQCNKGKYGVQITQTVELSNVQFYKPYKIRSINNNIVQAIDALIFLNDDDTQQEIVPLDFPTQEYSCFQSTQLDDLILSLCHDGNQYTIYATSGISLTGWFPLGEVLKLNAHTKKIQLLQNDYLIVLDNESFVISKLNMEDQDNWVLDEEYVININHIQNKYEELLTFTPNDFLITPVNKVDGIQYYKVLITSGEGIFFQDFYFQNQQFTIVNLEYVNLTTELQKIQQYAISSTQYLLVKELQSFNVNTLNVFIQTNNVVHYGLKIKFAIKEGQQYLAYQSLESQFLLNRYGNWNSVRNIAVSKSHAAIPYQNQDKIVIAIYPIGESTKPSTSIGSFSFTQDASTFNPLDFGLFFRNDKLYANSPSSDTQQYQINAEPSLIFTQTVDNPLKSEKVDIKVRNDFSQSQIDFDLKIIVNPDPPGPGPDPPGPEPEKSSKLWWIILIIVGGLLIAGFIGFIIYRAKNKAVEDEYNVVA